VFVNSDDIFCGRAKLVAESDSSVVAVSSFSGKIKFKP